MTTTIEKQRVIHATPQRTFQALTEKEELERWFVQKVEGDRNRPKGCLTPICSTRCKKACPS